MGQVIEIKCNQCGYSEKFYLGMGMRDCDKKVVEKYFTSHKAKELLDSGDNWYFNWKLAKCHTCKRLLRIPVLDMFNEIEGKYEFIENVCCGKQIDDVITIPEPANELYIQCPKCEEKLEVTETMLWD